MLKTTDLYSTYCYLRRKSFPWIIDSKKACKYKCILTGAKDNLQVHHAHKSFYAIVEEALQEANLVYKPSILNYTEDELKALADKCLEIHYRYGLGVVLSKKMHNKFHEKYKYDYTFQDFKDFTKNYKRKARQSLKNRIA